MYVQVRWQCELWLVGEVSEQGSVGLGGRRMH
jgi:hypothetical protein